MSQQEIAFKYTHIPIELWKLTLDKMLSDNQKLLKSVNVNLYKNLHLKHLRIGVRKWQECFKIHPYLKTIPKPLPKPYCYKRVIGQEGFWQSELDIKLLSLDVYDYQTCKAVEIYYDTLIHIRLFCPSEFIKDLACLKNLKSVCFDKFSAYDTRKLMNHGIESLSFEYNGYHSDTFALIYFLTNFDFSNLIHLKLQNCELSCALFEKLNLKTLEIISCIFEPYETTKKMDLNHMGRLKRIIFHNFKKINPNFISKLHLEYIDVGEFRLKIPPNLAKLTYCRSSDYVLEYKNGIKYLKKTYMRNISSKKNKDIPPPMKSYFDEYFPFMRLNFDGEENNDDEVFVANDPKDKIKLKNLLKKKKRRGDKIRDKKYSPFAGTNAK